MSYTLDRFAAEFSAEKANELTSPHIRTQAQGQHCIGSNRVL